MADALNTVDPRDGNALSLHLGRLRRFGGYAFWTFAAQAAPLGIDRLVVHPLLNKRLGEDLFGAFVWTLAIVQVAGIVVAKGIHMLLLRDLGQQSREDAQRTLQMALILTTCLSTVFLAAAAVASYFLLAPDIVQRHWPALFVPLCLFALMRSIQLVLLATVRINRLFRKQFVMSACEGLLLLAGVVFLYRQIHDFWLLGMIYVTSVLLPLPLLFAPNRELLSTRRRWEMPTARWLLVGSVAGMLITLTHQSQVYAARIALGVFSPAGEGLTEFYAGTSVGNIFVMPMGAISMLVLSILAGHQTYAFRGMRGRAYVAVTFATAIAVGLLSYLCGPWIIGLLYPNVAPRTISFYHWIVIAQACTVVGTMLRPAGIKYAPLSRIVTVQAVTLGVQIVSLVMLVPLAQARGAAMSQTISAAVGMVLWLLTFHRLGQTHGQSIRRYG